MTVDMDMGALPSFYYINKDQWTKLPEDLKKVIQSVIDDQPAFIADLVSRLRKEAEEVVQKRNIQVYHFPKADREKLLAKSAEVWEEWAKRSGNSYSACKTALEDYMRIRDVVVAKYPKGLQ